MSKSRKIMTFWMHIQIVSKESQTGNKICNSDLFSVGSVWSPIAPVMAETCP